MTIILDPGHGGTRDNGKSTFRGVRGPGGTAEKDVTIRLARRVAHHLGGAATLTRDEAGNPTLAARAAAARRNDAEVFVSLHANEGPPGSRGPEIWVHDQAGPPSLALSRAIQGQLSRLGGAAGAVRHGRFAVLTPDRLARRTAACLVEVDYLSDPAAERRFGSPEALDGIARAIAGGIQGYLRQPGAFGGAAPARALEDYPSPYEPYEFTDADQLTATMRNQRAQDTRTVSSRADAHAVIQAFRGSSAVSPWISLSRAEVADRLDRLIDDSGLFLQGNLNLCGPAAFLNVWTRRDPLAFARFATTLFDTGRASIGSFDVAPSDSLVRNDYAAMLSRGVITPQADWMTMGALRNNDDAIFVWTGEPGDDLGGMTFPEEIERWLRATGLYRTIDNQVGNSLSALSSKGFNAAADLQVREGTDIIVLIQANMCASQIGAAVTGGFLSHFSNHWVVLISDVLEIVDDHSVAFPIWTFGQDYPDVRVATVPLFADNYYGAIVATM
jgi:hypothetical protein